jgi:hypothetical protein
MPLSSGRLTAGMATSRRPAFPRCTSLAVRSQDIGAERCVQRRRAFIPGLRLDDVESCWRRLEGLGSSCERGCTFRCSTVWINRADAAVFRLTRVTSLAVETDGQHCNFQCIGLAGQVTAGPRREIERQIREDASRHANRYRVRSMAWQSPADELTSSGLSRLLEWPNPRASSHPAVTPAFDLPNSPLSSAFLFVRPSMTGPYAHRLSRRIDDYVRHRRPRELWLVHRRNRTAGT